MANNVANLIDAAGSKSWQRAYKAGYAAGYKEKSNFPEHRAYREPKGTALAWRSGYSQGWFDIQAEKAKKR